MTPELKRVLIRGLSEHFDEKYLEYIAEWFATNLSGLKYSEDELTHARRIDELDRYAEWAIEYCFGKIDDEAR